MRYSFYTVSICGILAAASATQAALVPYSTTPDSNTTALYKFSESSGNVVNYGTAGSSYDLTNTGGPTGRASGGGGYGAASYSAVFGNAFSMYKSGNGGHVDNGSFGDNSMGGGASTSKSPQSLGWLNDLVNPNGAFTMDFMFNPRFNDKYYTFLSRDSLGTRGFNLELANIGGAWRLNLYNGSQSVNAPALPTSGPNAYTAGRWYHVAVTYNGLENTANNIQFYWTAVDASVTEAALLGTGSMAADLQTATTDNQGQFFVGSQGRGNWRSAPEFMDEVRFSNTVRTAGDFIFVPEPSALTGIAVAGLLMSRRKR